MGAKIQRLAIVAFLCVVGDMSGISSRLASPW
jgi:hypothetical protein